MTRQRCMPKCIQSALLAFFVIESSKLDKKGDDLYVISTAVIQSLSSNTVACWRLNYKSLKQLVFTCEGDLFRDTQFALFSIHAAFVFISILHYCSCSPAKESHFADANPRVNDKPTIFLSHKYTQAQTL